MATGAVPVSGGGGGTAATGTAADPILLAPCQWFWFVSNSDSGNNGPDWVPNTAAGTLTAGVNEALSSRLAVSFNTPVDCKILGSVANRTAGMQIGDRILFASQWDGADQGIYTITDLGSAGTPWVLTRAIPLDTVAYWGLPRFYRVSLEGTAAFAFTTTYQAFQIDFASPQLQSWAMSTASGLATGYGAQAMRDSVALGNESIASGLWSVAIGRSTQATASKAMALGDHAKAKFISSVAVGYNAAAYADQGVTIGGGKQVVIVPKVESWSVGFTIANSNLGNIIEITAAGAVNLLLPDDAGFDFIPAGTSFQVRQTGAGQVTVAMAGGVNTKITSYAGRKTAGQYAIITVTKLGGYLDERWAISGQSAV